MSKKKRKNNKESQVQKRKKQPIMPKLESEGQLPPGAEEFAQAYFADMSGDLEEITDELIEELVSAGTMPRDALIQARDMGMVYSRKRNSFWQG